MSLLNNPRKRLILILWIVSFHSFCVGLGLIFLPDWLAYFMGFKIPVERFFPTQAGVFHFIMAIAYLTGSFKLPRWNIMILFAIAAKLIAMIFLFVYFIFADPIWSLLLSAVSDGLLGVIILFSFISYKNSSEGSHE